MKGMRCEGNRKKGGEGERCSEGKMGINRRGRSEGRRIGEKEEQRKGTEGRREGGVKKRKRGKEGRKSEEKEQREGPKEE
jgi:hypothetical protein